MDLFFSRSSHTSDLQLDTPVAILPGAWRLGARWPGVSIVWLGERKSDLQLLSQCGRSMPEIHKHVAGTLSNQQTNNPLPVKLEVGVFPLSHRGSQPWRLRPCFLTGHSLTLTQSVVSYYIYHRGALPSANSPPPSTRTQPRSSLLLFEPEELSGLRPCSLWVLFSITSSPCSSVSSFCSCKSFFYKPVTRDVFYRQ